MKALLYLLLFVSIASCGNMEEKKQLAKTSPEVELIEGNYNVAFLITEGTYNTEFIAPWDVFDHVRFRDVDTGMNLFTVSNTSDAITTFEGLKIQPDFNFLKDELPPIDILIIPSAEHHLDSDLEDKKLVAFVKRAANEAKWVATHCDGSFLLAKTRLLDGRHCTTFPADVPLMREMFDKTKVHDSVLFMQDTKYITSVGGAKSFEASLYLCQILYDDQVAKQLAEGLVLDWGNNKLDFGFFPVKDPNNGRAVIFCQNVRGK